MLSALGGSSVGFVWGWLVGSHVGPRMPRFGPAFLLCLATFVFATEIFLLAGWLSVALFLPATFFALGLHLIGFSVLQRRLTH